MYKKAHFGLFLARKTEELSIFYFFFFGTILISKSIIFNVISKDIDLRFSLFFPHAKIYKKQSRIPITRNTWNMARFLNF
jgi:hypothetical protein